MERQKQTKHIGTLESPLLVFGGVYSNWQALQQLYLIAGQMNIPEENIICTGDIAGYCADPEACVQFIKDWGIHCIAGNVELQLREGEEDCGCDFDSGGRCDTFSRQWYPFAKAAMSEESINWMKDLPDFIRFNYRNLEALVVHGSYFHTSEYIFKSTEWKKKQQNFVAAQAELIIAGHCGLPFHHIQEDRYWLNPGVIGMPANDGTTRVWFMKLEEATSEFFQHLSYNYAHQAAANAMKTRKLPAAYADSLITGMWDNCEILPEEETRQQGLRLSFRNGH